MPDYFALLEQPRQPWPDDAALRDAFHRLAATQHPDARTGDADGFANLNAAFTTLSDPVKRLRHWLELEHPDALHRATVIPPDLAELFPVIGAARQALLDFAARRRNATTALSLALLAGDEARVRANADTARAALDAARERAVESLRTLDAARSAPEALAALHGRFAFLEKWDAQLREAALQVEIG